MYILVFTFSFFILPFLIVIIVPECGANPCTNSSLPVNGNHACAICKVELHGPCGVF